MPSGNDGGCIFCKYRNYETKDYIASENYFKTESDGGIADLDEDTHASMALLGEDRLFLSICMPLFADSSYHGQTEFMIANFSANFCPICGSDLHNPDKED